MYVCILVDIIILHAYKISLKGNRVLVIIQIDIDVKRKNCENV